MISVLKRALTRSHEKGFTQRAWLASEQAVHINGEPWDRTWGCGCVPPVYLTGRASSYRRYRNYLMACASLMNQRNQPMYFPLLDGILSPGVRNLQLLLEKAWQDGKAPNRWGTHYPSHRWSSGHDEDGAHQLKHKLVDTTKWIGTAGMCTPSPRAIM